MFEGHVKNMKIPNFQEAAATSKRQQQIFFIFWKATQKYENPTLSKRSGD